MSGFDENADVIGDRSMLNETEYTQPQHYVENDVLEVLDVHSSYSSRQIALLKIFSRIASVVSFLACGWLLLEIWYHSNKRYYVYHKLVSAIALYCLLVSVWYFVGDWAWAGGSEVACQMQGFFAQLSLGPLLLLAMLFLYFMLVISFSFPEQLLTSNHAQRQCATFCLTWQQMFHILPLVVSVGTASASAALDLFHPSSHTTWCWIDTPTMIDNDEYDSAPNRIPAFQWGFYLGPAWLSFAVMGVAFLVVVRGVQAQEKRMKKYVTASTIRQSRHGGITSTSRHGGTTSTSSNPANSSSYVGRASPMNSMHRSEHNTKGSASASNEQANVSTGDSFVDASIVGGIYGHKNESRIGRLRAFFFRRHMAAKEYWQDRPRTRQVAVQCGCYVGAFFWSNIFLTVNQIFAWRNQGNSDVLNPYVLVLLQAIYQPLLGFFVLLAYRRPFYMRIRREGVSRGKALLICSKWNQNPIDPPSQRRTTKAPLQRRKREKLTPEQKEQKRREKAEKKARKQRFRDEQRPPRWHSEPVMRLSGVRGSSKHLTTSFLELLGKHGNNNFASAKENGPLSTLEEDPSKMLDEASYGESTDGTRNLAQTDNTQSTIGTAEMQPHQMRLPAKSGSDSFSTLDTRRTSVLTKEDSSRRFELQKEGSLRLNDLLRESGEEEKSSDSDASLSLEQLVGESDDSESRESDKDEKHDESSGEDESYEEETNGGDEESQDTGEFHSFGRSQMRGDFALIKQSSDRYKDLVFLDIIPEADGDMEERWRIIESKVKRYKKTKHDKHKFNMSVPVISERNFDPVDMVGHPSDQKGDDAEAKSDIEQPNQRFAWAKNPLFKVSGRKQTDSSSSTQSKRAPPPSFHDSGDLEKGLPHRTSSGGYFSRAKNRKTAIKFWAKLEREKSRQATLQAISSRRIQSVQSAERDELLNMVGSASSATVGHERTPGKKEESENSFAPNSSNPLLDAGVDQSAESEDSGEFLNPVSGGGLDENDYEDGWMRVKEPTKGSVNSPPQPRDIPPTYFQKRISSGEFSTRMDGSENFESSNEMTQKSNGSSIRTIKRSNRKRPSSERVQRISASSNISSGVSSEEVSLVSDGPISDDDFLSGSGSDNDDSDVDDGNERDGKTPLEANQQGFSNTLRASLEELQRVSERSMEGELGESSSSIHVDPSDLLLQSTEDPIANESAHTEQA